MPSKWKQPDDITTNISWVTHPYIAYIFSFFDGTASLDEILINLADISGMDKNELQQTIFPFIENKEMMTFPTNKLGCYSLPKNFLIKKTNEISVRKPFIFDLQAMIKDFDMKSFRQYIPNNMVLMVNNNCITDCVYCYADTAHKVKKTLPFERITELITEASLLGMNDFEIGGGDFFMYKYWQELLPELIKHEYLPYISTKYPITENIIQILKQYPIKGIQLSIDSVNNEEIKKILNVGDDYLDKVKKGIHLLNEAGIEICIKPVITKYNDSEESVTNLLKYVTQFEMVKTINITPGSYSIYKPFTFSTTLKHIAKIRDITNQFSKEYPNIAINTQGANSYVTVEERMKSFPKRGLCSGNMSSFYTLPDGKVTLCEQLYWHPFFILGDLSTQSIMEMWNSEKALKLWNFSQNEVKESSPCKTCADFETCRRGKGNCWRFAIAAYGKENYDFPSPNCPLAPEITHPYFIPD
jgi:radical SAM protein with 4Fe4S-binding SPASM domain